MFKSLGRRIVTRQTKFWFYHVILRIFIGYGIIFYNFNLCRDEIFDISTKIYQIAVFEVGETSSFLHPSTPHVTHSSDGYINSSM